MSYLNRIIAVSLIVCLAVNSMSAAGPRYQQILAEQTLSPRGVLYRHGPAPRQHQIVQWVCQWLPPFIKRIHYRRRVKAVKQSHWGLFAPFKAQIQSILDAAKCDGIDLRGGDLFGVGVPFETNGPLVQFGVNPHTLIPGSNRSGMYAKRIAYYRALNRDTTINVDRNGVLQQGNHRLAAAILEDRSVDVVIHRYAGERREQSAA